MPVTKVETDDFGIRVVASKRLEVRLDASQLARSQAVSTVKNTTVRHYYDSSQQSALSDVGAKCLEFFGAQHREQVRRWMSETVGHFECRFS
jgi:hypothetical protein